MSKNLQFYTRTIPAGTSAAPGCVVVEAAGSICLIKTATNPFKLQFDADAPFDAEGGYLFDERVTGPEGFRKVTLLNPNNYSITVTFAIGSKGVNYIGGNLYKVAPTYTKGTQLTINKDNTTMTTIPAGSDNGHQRKHIIIDVGYLTSGEQLLIFGANMGQGISIPAGSLPIIIETDGVMYCKGYGLTTQNRNLNILEVYYAQ